MKQNELGRVIDAWLPKLLLINEERSMQAVGTRWNRKQVLGHLIDSAANNHQRFIRLQNGDLSGFPGYDQDQWVEKGQYERNSWSNLVQLWYLYNQQLALIIEHADTNKVRSVWREKNVDLQFLIDDYVVHMVHHVERLV